MADYLFNDISAICDGKYLSNPDALLFSQLLIDSRKVWDPSRSLFIAIGGERHDGHAFISDLYEKGVRQFIVEKELDISSYPDAGICFVKSSIYALQQLASFHRRKFKIPVIGITGSNGKTVVKEWINTLLAADFRIVRSPRSYNSQVGVPLSVWNMNIDHDLAIFEAGISHPGEMEKLEKVIQPDICIFTHIGKAHLENFDSEKELVKEKMGLCKNAKVIVYGSDNETLRKAMEDRAFADVRKIVWSYQRENCPPDGLWISNEDKGSGATIITCIQGKESFHFYLPFSDAASVENCITCIACLLYLDYDQEQINERIQRLTALHMRLEVLEGINHCTLVNDSYSNDLHSLEIALDFLKSNAGGKKTVAILSDIVQSGIREEELYGIINNLLLSKDIDKLIAIGPEIRAMKEYIQLTSHFYDSTDSFLTEFNQLEFSDYAILVKGARAFQFENIVHRLQDKTHETRLEVDLNAMLNNLNYFRSRLSAGTKLMVMVKAFGYGTGAQEVSSLLQFNRVDYLAVAYADEGVELRKAGISLPIMVMNPEPSSYATILRYKLEPEIYSLSVLKQFEMELGYHNLNSAYLVHLKIDTGMHRLGFMEGDIEELCTRIVKNGNLHISSVFTHLSSSENPEHDHFTRKQLERFESVCKIITAKTGQTYLRHALNTGGIQRFPDAQYEMVRLGIGLYGVASFSDDQHRLSSVSSFLSKISQIKNIGKGDVVGYAVSFVAPAPMKIAIVPVGYADGLKRSLSNGRGHLSIKGKKAKILGRVCMDMVMVDISSIDCEEGDDVEIFGSHISLEEYAGMCSTIPYEVLTSISHRVKRVYLQE